MNRECVFRRAVVAALMLVTAGAALSASSYDRHVVFDNSLTPGSYYHSRGAAVAPSELQLTDGKLPVHDRGCVTAPNCLRLTWQSRRGGDWRATISLRKHYGGLDFSGDSLSFWFYTEQALGSDASPLNYVTDQRGESSPSIRLLGTRNALPAQKWVRVPLPFTSFVGLFESTRDVRFDSQHLASVTILQGLDDGVGHTLYIDEVRIDDQPAVEDVTPPATPGPPTARGYDRHIEVGWSEQSEPDLLHYRIYCSLDGTTYVPIGIQKAGRHRFVDFLGAPDRSAFYQVTAVDTSDNESARSNAVQASTRQMSDDELLTMVQEAGFRFYWDAAHRTAGMAIEILPGDENLVAVGASGFGILSIVVAADRGSSPAWMRRSAC